MKTLKYFSRFMLLILAITLPLSFSACDQPVAYGKGRLEILDKAKEKYKLHLEGTAYEMGAQHGYLLATQVRETTSNDFYKTLVLDMIGGDSTVASIVSDPTIVSVIVGFMESQAALFSVYCTEDMRQEMKGIADGAIKRLNEMKQPVGNVSYTRVLLTNMGFDIVLGYVYPFIIKQYMNDQQKWAFNQRHPDLHMCDGFVATGAATRGGGTIMGRSFMIPTVISDKGLIMEYVPSKGNRFVACNIPGFVGTPVAMNQYGVCIGMDMVSAARTNIAAPGMGCLLTARYVMQWESGVDGAMRAIRESVARGISWLYVVADRDRGAVAEAAATFGFGWMPDQQKYFNARYMDYAYDITKTLQPGIDQIETRDDLVVLSNHFIDPVLQASSDQFAIKDSIVRYDYLTGITLEAINGGGIDVPTAKQLVNYLSPQSDNPYGNDVIPNPFADDGTINAGDYYANTTHVHGVRAVFDVASMQMNVLWRMWDDPWVAYKW